MSARSDRVTSTHYSRPYRPRVVALANAVGRWLGVVGLAAGPLTVDGLLEAARRATGLDDFGDPGFREPLAVLLDAIEREAELHTVGRLITRGRLVGVLCNRLRVEDCCRRHPVLLRQPVRAPIVIAGLQRTGTTLLHRLIAADPDIRSLASWEAVHPAPMPRRPWHWRDPRIRKAHTAERALRYLAPDFFAIHPVEAEAPEEDVMLLDHSFLSTVPEATLRVPSYARWLEEQDQGPAYRYLEKLLQLLQWQRAAERWVLKSPHHLEWLDTLLERFPDAKIIQTHRDPLRTTASLCSMIAHARGVFSDEVDPHEVGHHWLRKARRLVERAMASRARASAAHFLDVSYYDLVDDPLAQVERIYAFMGRSLSQRARRAMVAAQRRSVPHEHGRHRYRLEHFGIRPDDVELAFGRYRGRFGLRRE